MGTVLSVLKLSKTYEVQRTAFSVNRHHVKAVNGVSFDLEKGKTIGIVGESGSGKSTLARCILLLDQPDSGEIRFLGNDLLKIKRSELRKLRKEMQMIFQDPYSSLNPRKKVFSVIAEPLIAQGMVEKKEAMREVVADLLKKVGLSEDFLDKYPHEMSGGQRQRIAIGRAIATNPSLIIADEPVSSLDVSIQAQIINLFEDIVESMDISMIFVSHDLNIVRFVADDIMVMYQGNVVEMGNRDEVFSRPLHPYTDMLINASQGDFRKTADAGMNGDMAGCPYAAMCERKRYDCMERNPELTGDANHKVACLFVA